MKIKAINIQISVLFLSLCIFLNGCGLVTHPSDIDFEQRLGSKEKGFNRLAAMLSEDLNVVRLDNGNLFLNDDSKPGLTRDRLAEYRDLFRELSLENGIHRDNPHQVRLIVSTKGLVSPSSEKSFAYSTEKPAPLVDSIDGIVRKDNAEQSPVYKSLGGNWYIFYEQW